MIRENLGEKLISAVSIVASPIIEKLVSNVVIAEEIINLEEQYSMSDLSVDSRYIFDRESFLKVRQERVDLRKWVALGILAIGLTQKKSWVKTLAFGGAMGLSVDALMQVEKINRAKNKPATKLTELFRIWTID